MVFTITAYITEIRTACILKKKDVLDKANLVGKELYQGKNDYKTGGFFYDLFHAPKIQYCLTNNEFGIIEEHKTF